MHSGYFYTLFNQDLFLYHFHETRDNVPDILLNVCLPQPYTVPFAVTLFTTISGASNLSRIETPLR